MNNLSFIHHAAKSERKLTTLKNTLLLYLPHIESNGSLTTDWSLFSPENKRRNGQSCKCESITCS